MSQPRGSRSSPPSSKVAVFFGILALVATLSAIGFLLLRHHSTTSLVRADSHVCDSADTWLIVKRVPAKKDQPAGWQHGGHNGKFVSTANGPETGIVYVSSNGSFNWRYHSTTPVGLIMETTTIPGGKSQKSYYSRTPASAPKPPPGSRLTTVWVCGKADEAEKNE